MFCVCARLSGDAVLAYFQLVSYFMGTSCDDKSWRIFFHFDH